MKPNKVGECLSNDLGDTSTACTNLYGNSKPVCDTSTNMCIPLKAPCKSSDPNSMCTISCSTTSIQTIEGTETAVIGDTKGYWKLTTTGRNQVSFLDNPSSTLDPILSVGKNVGGNDICNINAKSFGSETCQATLNEGTYYIKIDHAGTTSGKDKITVTCQRLLAPPILKSPNDFATLTDSTPALEWERNSQNANDANFYQWYVRTTSETRAQAALAGRGGTTSSFSLTVSKTTPLLEPKIYLWSASQGKSTNGIFSFSEYADERFFTLCGTCQSAKDLGALNDYGNTVLGTTCGLSSSATNDIFKFAVSKTGYLKVDMYGPYDEFFGTPSGCDWDFWVNADGFCGSETIYIARSDATSIKCDDSATGQIFVTGDKYVKVHRNLGDGSGSINVKLLECVANNALDSACPSAKPYCSGNKCVECVGNPDGTFKGCLGTDGTTGTYCPKDTVSLPLCTGGATTGCHDPNSIVPRCTLSNICQCEESCGTGLNRNVLCALGFCCTGESVQGPNKKLPGKTVYTCEPISTIVNPWLCI